MSRDKKTKHALVFSLVFLVIIWICGYLAFVFTIDIYRSETQNTNLKHYQTDAIVVLTGGSNRLNSGFELLQKGVAERIFITGVNSEVRDQEVLQTINTEINEDTLKCCVEFGASAFDTKGNAHETKKWMAGKADIRSIVLVTSEYHIPRSLMEFHAKMPDIEIMPYAVKSSLSTDNVPEYLKVTFIEYNKTLIRWIKINIL